MSDFRISANNLSLTYPGCELDKEVVLDLLKVKLDKYIVAGYLISKERSKDHVHIHVFVKLLKKTNIKNSNYLDLKLGDKVYHGNYQITKSKNNWLNYIAKDNDFITEGLNFEKSTCLDSSGKKSKKDAMNEFLLDLAEREGLSKAMFYFRQTYPELVTSKYSSIKSNLNDYLSTRAKISLCKHNLEDYIFPEELENWYTNLSSLITLLFHGKTDLGKTQGLLAFFELKKEKTFLAKTLEELKNLTEEHTVVIFDDIEWDNVSRAERLILLDKDVSNSIRILYQTVELNCNLKKVVVTNTSRIPDLCNLKEKSNLGTTLIHLPEVERRLHKVELKSLLFIRKDKKDIPVPEVIPEVIVKENSRSLDPIGDEILLRHLASPDLSHLSEEEIREAYAHNDFVKLKIWDVYVPKPYVSKKKKFKPKESVEEEEGMYYGDTKD